MKLVQFIILILILSGSVSAQKEGAELESAYANLKAAEAKKDSAEVLKWSAATSEAAKKIMQAPKGVDQSAEEHKSAVDYAKQVDVYTEYSIYAAALGETDPQKVMKLTSALEERNPKSQYLLQMMPKYTASARQAGALPAAVATGVRAYSRGQLNEDLLLLMADQAMTQKNFDKSVEYASKTIELMQSQPKPETISDADWTKKKNTTTGLAYWMQGMSLINQNKLAAADKALRAALPLIKETEQLAGPALFQLGMANYKMAQAKKNKAQAAEAVAFFKQAASYKGIHTAQAVKNVAVVQKEFAIR